MITNSIRLGKIVLRLGKILPILFIMLSIPTIFGYDTDFGYYATAAKMIASGLEMYQQIYDHKPPLYHHVLSLGEYINEFLETNLFGFFCIHFIVVASFYCISHLLFKQIADVSDIKWSYHFDLLFFSFLTTTLLASNLQYGNLNGGIVFFATSFELFAVFWLLRAFKNGLILKDFIILGTLTAGAFLSRVHFGAFMAICIFLILSGESWQKNISNLMKYVLLSFLISIIGVYFLTSDFESFYQAVITDNVTYTQEKIGQYPEIVKTGYYSIKTHIFLILFVLISTFVSIFECKSVRLVIENLRLLFIKKSIAFTVLLTISISIVVVLTKPGGHAYRYYGATPILVICGIFLISSISSRKSLDRICLIALITTGVFYCWSLSKINFMSWEKNQFLALLEENKLGGESFFTVDYNSWLYLKTDTIPVLKSQYLKNLVYPSDLEKKKALESILRTKPKFLTFSASNNGQASNFERFVSKNYDIFIQQYKFKGFFDTPYEGVRVWERKL